MRIRSAIRGLASLLPGNGVRSRLFRLGAVNLAEGVYIARGVKLGSGVSIGRNTSIRSRVIVGAEAKIGNSVEIGSGAVLCPKVVIGNAATIGERSLLRNCRIGDHSFVEHGVVCAGNDQNWITIGQYSYIGVYGVLDNTGGIQIGDYVHIAGPTVGIWTHTSIYQSLAGSKPDDLSRKVIAPVQIENNVWVGGNSTIYPGVRIAHHSAILPNSAVTDNSPPFSMVGGVPARVIKHIEIDEGEIRFVKKQIGDKG